MPVTSFSPAPPASAARQNDLPDYRQIVEAAGDVIYRIDSTGIFTYVNARVKKLLGYTAEEVIGKHFSVFIAPAWREKVEAFYTSQFRGQVSESTLEFPALTRRGEEIWVEQTVMGIVEDRQIVGFQAIVRDVSLRKRAETELTLRLEQLAALQRVDFELMQNLDIDYLLTMALDQTVRLSRADSGFIGLVRGNDLTVMAQAIGNYPLSPHVPYLDPETGIVGRCLVRRAPELVTHLAAAGLHSVLPDIRAQVAIPLMSRDNPLGVLCLETRSPERFTGQILAFIQLITTRIAAAVDNAQLYAAVQHQLAELHELYALKMRFVSMVSHEFRTPLATILSANNNLHDYFDRMTPEDRTRHFEKTQAQIDHMTHILDDVLVIGRIESGAIQCDPAPMNLDALCQQIVEEFRMHMHKPIAIVYDSDGCCPDALLDEKLMRQIITNLLTNAVKYSLADRPIAMTLRHDADEIVLQVRDEGIGIPESEHGHLFQPFHRAANVGAVAGTGLGLAIAQYAAELHGGKITFTSKEGVGSTFTVTLPQNKEMAR